MVNVCIHDVQEQTSSSDASQSLMNKCLTSGPENESQKMKSLIFESLLIKGLIYIEVREAKPRS